jgi:uncharacterized 2Fe-2S/4Fe-4S cluster protein (DUF4445 family)
LETGASVGLVVAGAFGSGLRPETAARLGIVPAEWAASIRQAGNASLDGAALALIRDGFRKELARIADEIEVVDLAADPDFEAVFMSALGLAPWSARDLL